MLAASTAHGLLHGSACLGHHIPGCRLTASLQHSRIAADYYEHMIIVIIMSTAEGS